MRSDLYNIANDVRGNLAEMHSDLTLPELLAVMAEVTSRIAAELVDELDEGEL